MSQKSLIMVEAAKREWRRKSVELSREIESGDLE